MRIGILIAAIAGLALATALVAYFGVGDVAVALAAAGWTGLAVVVLIHLVPLMLCASAWRLVVPAPRPSFLQCLRARWVREAVGNLMGILPVTGELVGARFLSFGGPRPLRAAASVVVDLTAESVSQLFFTLIGLAVLSIALSPADAAPWLLAGFATMLPVAAVPLVARSRRVLRMLEGLAGRVAASLKLPRRDDGETLVETVHGIFRMRAAVAGSVFLHLVAWLGAAVETWALLRVAGNPVPFGAAVAIEALVFAVRGAIFMVPSSIGIQEGGYVVVAALFGLGPETALAISLIKRARDLVLGIPGLILWQAIEGTRLRRRLAAATPPG